MKTKGIDYGIIPAWELRQHITRMWKSKDFGLEFDMACYAWKCRFKCDFLVADLIEE